MILVEMVVKGLSSVTGNGLTTQNFCRKRERELLTVPLLRDCEVVTDKIQNSGDLHFKTFLYN